MEQRLAMPILYCMSEMIVKKNKNSNNNTIIDGYLRDNLHLSSQSKLRRDGMSQTSKSKHKISLNFRELISELLESCDSFFILLFAQGY